ncbi:DUF4386 domain-containing protein [Tropicimonas aquimaris]|uniref:DUF4386 domain-containing protein n=1 Tax=Tropicimonas aquimaris TaxID=914152 RepID=A0ABW3INP6_9RHOB
MSDFPRASRGLFRLAGLFYLLIIVCGLWAELAVRGPVLALKTPALQSAAILANEGRFRLGLVADAVMALSDVALAGLLFVILAPAGMLLAGLATAFRLVQAAIIGMSLMLPYAALHLATTTPGAPPPLAGTLLALHGVSYDVGLAFFGVNCLLTSVLLRRSPAFPGWLGWLIGAAGVVYLTGTALRLVAPSMVPPFVAAYIVPAIAELAFCLWLLAGGRRQVAARA